MKLKLPQARVLNVLFPPYPEDPEDEWPLYTRSTLGVKAGFTVVSGSVTRALNGIKPGSSSGKPSPGLLALGLAKAIDINVDGVVEINYRITGAGIQAIRDYLAAGNKLPNLRGASVHTNNRYINAEPVS